MPAEAGCVILAAGRGERLGAITRTVPKPLVLVGGETVLGSIIRSARDGGCRPITVTTHHLAEQISAEASRYGAAAQYQAKLSGPAGSLLQALSATSNSCLVVAHGDVWSSIDFAHLLKSHRTSGCLVTIVGVNVPDATGLGLLNVAENRLRSLSDKSLQAAPGFVNSGVYVFERSVLNTAFRRDEPVLDFSTVFSRILLQQVPVNVFEHTGQWHDIGTPAALLAANREYLRDTNRLDRIAIPVGPDLWMIGDGPCPWGDSPPVSVGPSLIFSSARVGKDVVLDGAVVGPHASVENGAHLIDSLVLPFAVVGAGKTLKSKVISA